MKWVIRELTMSLVILAFPACVWGQAVSHADGKEIALAPVSDITKARRNVRTQAEGLLDELRVLSPFFKHETNARTNSDNEGTAAISGIAAKDSVDHRSCQTPILDQGERGTCTAFAATAALEAFESCRNHKVVQLSEEDAYHIYMKATNCTCGRDCGATTYKTAEYLTNNRICTAAQMPYTPKIGALPADDNKHVTSACSTGNRYGFMVTGTQIVLGTDYGGPQDQNANNPEYLESLLYTSYDLVYGLWVAGTSWSDGGAESGIVDVQLQNGKPAPSVGGHAMLLVGYDRPHSYFIFKNSWGTQHGHSGYFYLSYDYIRTYGKYGYAVTKVAD